jgi:thioredoxin reductase/Pyruvate/2-oxoacid:ferredoxin oxidoreductase delta subunit
MNELPLWAIYVLPLAVILSVYLLLRRRRESRARDTMRRAEAAGLTDPPSLHPVIDHDICMGSGACARACPEGTLGVVNGKAHLINPTVCIGHGACAAACPVEAIKLVFGTERRGVDIPLVKPNFETNVAGVYIAGELGGMGLIRKAAEQGRQAMESIGKTRGEPDQLDVLIVGAGPAGLSATLAAMEKKLRFVTVEQEDSLGGTVYHYPRNKIVMSQPVTLPLVGKVRLGEISKESLLAFWQDIVGRVSMPIRYGERLEKIDPLNEGFAVKTARAEYRTRNVLLAIGRRGTPRKLAVPGEELPKVVYRLVDPEQYRGKRVLVVGGGDSAIEAAVAIAGEAGAHATLSYRGKAFGRVKPQNRERLASAEASGKLRVMLESSVLSIDAAHAVLEHKGGPVTIDNDAIIVCAGGILPTPMLKDIGIIVETKYGTA